MVRLKREAYLQTGLICLKKRNGPMTTIDEIRIKTTFGGQSSNF